MKEAAKRAHAPWLGGMELGVCKHLSATGRAGSWAEALTARVTRG